jgi:hypothetical protein
MLKLTKLVILFRKKSFIMSLRKLAFFSKIYIPNGKLDQEYTSFGLVFFLSCYILITVYFWCILVFFLLKCGLITVYLVFFGIYFDFALVFCSLFFVWYMLVLNSILLAYKLSTCSILIVSTISMLRYYENATLFSTLFLGRLHFNPQEAAKIHLV